MLGPMLRAAAGNGGAASFDPLSLSPLVFYDPLDMSTLYQDTSGAVPVTADGQTVKRIDDKSGNGYHATGSLGPVFRVDGFLELNGVDQGLTVSVPTFAYPYSMIAASGRDGSSGLSGAFTLSNTGTSGNSIGVSFLDGSAARAWVYDATIFSASSVSNSDSKAVLSGVFAALGSHAVVNGVAGTDVTGNVAGATSLNIGVLNRPVKAFYGGENGALLVFDYDIGDANRALCEQWVADRYGIVI